MKRGILRAVRWADDRIRPLYGLAGEKPKLLGFLLHGLYDERSGFDREAVVPSLQLSLGRLRRFIDFFLGKEFTFVSVADVLGGLPEGGHYVLLSFDDGYFNNTLAIDILAEFQVPAVFAISTGYIETGRAYWGDALWRGLHRAGKGEKEFIDAVRELKTKPFHAIEAEIAEWFGKDIFRPVGDGDRPMTAAELRDFATARFVSLANHTTDHAILTNHDDAGIEAQISGAQAKLQELVGFAPDCIAYPDGAHSERVVGAAQRNGLKLGLTTEPITNVAPPTDLMRVGRLRWSQKIGQVAKVYSTE